MSQRVDVAVAGLSSLLGETFLEVLNERQFPVNELFLLGDEEDAGKKFEFRDHYLKVSLAETFDFSRVKLLFLLDVPALAAAVGERAAAEGCAVIDLSGHFQDMPGVPVVVPEINGDVLSGPMAGQIIASPVGAAAPLALLLAVLHRQAGIARIDITALAPVSWAGRSGIEALAGQTASLLNAKPITTERFPKQCAFNILPQVGEMTGNGYTTEEISLVTQLSRVMALSGVPINVTAVQVPVFFGYGAVVHLELARHLSMEEVAESLTAEAGIEVMSEEYPTAVTDALGQDLVFVGRIRAEEADHNSLELWAVFDQARKGGVTNAIQTAEAMLKSYT